MEQFVCMHLMVFFGGSTQQHNGTIYCVSTLGMHSKLPYIELHSIIWDFIYDMQWENDAKNPRENQCACCCIEAPKTA